MIINFKIIGKNQLNMIKELWEKLNKIHLTDSKYFKDHYEKFTFEKRCEKFNLIDDNKIRIEVIENQRKFIGYCISTIENDNGEIDSLFVEDKYRKSGYGSQLLENAVKWLKYNNCKKIMVSVAEGHESVIEFYMKHKFYPRLTYLYLKE
ncbi:MAG TPA: GNAT family N-acetyltransferase [Spirochaetota bacterium]|nr:GNAT family N-acetyltransferase [Spirochaetota bacterium]HOL57186.1 GNAT family N-acetyltransferase [Spirochaetota bacterium]HPP04824.1 GNAT family N-acetyltransferase [Spirochaetota bacterium]